MENSCEIGYLYSKRSGQTMKHKFYCNMVYGKTTRKIGALMQVEPVYVRVDAFDEDGIARGNVEKLGAAKE